MSKEQLPFSELPLPEKGCWNCLNYNGDFCTKEWNNLDECYKVVWRDSKEPEDCCDDWALDDTISSEEFF